MFQLHTAPSSPPTNVSADVIDSTTAVLSWEFPPAADHNGIIRFFAINLTETDSGSQIELTVEAAQKILSSLHPFYTYKIEVAAVTTDRGPYSPPILFQLPEDGESMHFICCAGVHLLYTLCHVHNYSSQWSSHTL